MIESNIVDIFRKKIFYGRLSFRDGKIISIEEIGDEKKGCDYVLPGFVDAHVHTESSMLCPDEFARVALMNGTVAAVADPHEIANVLGVDGVRYIIENASHTPFYFGIGAPSCVPSTSFETSGAVLDHTAVAELLKMPQVTHLSEVMNVPGVLFKDPDMMQKLQSARSCGKPIDGHAPLLKGDDLKKYVAEGISTDHECTNIDEAREKSAAGMIIQIRQGSAGKDFDALHPILEVEGGKLMFCTDDCHPDYLREGPIRQLVIKAISMGYDIWKVLGAACVTPVLHYALGCGLLREGDNADFIIVDNLVDFNLKAEYLKGVCYDSEHTLPTIDSKNSTELIPNNFLSEEIDVLQLRCQPADPSHIRVIGVSEGSLITEDLSCEALIEDGYAVSDPSRDILKIVVLNRYTKGAKPAVGFVKGFHLKKGAIASSVAHDSHNIICTGTSDEEITAAINAIIKMKGGLACVCDGKLTCLPLPVGGIFSAAPYEEVVKDYIAVRDEARILGCPFRDCFMALSFLALPVIPWLKLTDKGLFDYKSFSLIDSEFVLK